MSIEEMLKDVKVEWNKLDNLLSYEQPNKYIVKNTNYSDKYSTPVLTAGQSFVLGYTDEIDGIYRASKENPVIIFDDFTTGNHWVDFHFKVKSSALKILKAKEGVNLRYLYHYIQILKIDTTEHKRLWISKFSQLQIPLPPLAIQEKIAKTLDFFTEYVTELQAELQNRKKQYEYYRDKLLDFSFEIPRINIKEVCEVRDGTHDSPKKVNDGKLLITSKNITKGYLELREASYISEDDYNKINVRSKVDKGDILISMIGTIGEILYVKDEPNYAIKNIGLIKPSESINGKFLYYYLKTSHIKNKFLSSVKKGSQTFLTLSILRSLEIPLPPLEKQNEIVDILDKFDTLCNSLIEGLPYEIELRQKQYEYYIEKLLTFTGEVKKNL